jgi:hypothetical protein
MSRRIIETFDRLGGLCFKIHLGIPMRIAAVRIEQSIEKELVVFLERIEPEPKTLPTHTKQPDEEFPSVFGDIRDTKTERLQ